METTPTQQTSIDSPSIMDTTAVANQETEIVLSANTNETTVSETTKKKRRKKGLIPLKDSVLISVSEMVLEKFKESGYFIPDVLPDEMELKVNQFSQAYVQKANASAQRLQVTELKKQLNAEINTNIELFKGGIYSFVGKKMLYKILPQYGVVKQPSIGYKLSGSTKIRMQQLDTLSDALIDSPYKDLPYGYEYWTGVRDRYKELFLKSENLDNQKTYSTNEKAELREYLRDALDAIIDLIRIYYRKHNPDSVLLQWGFDPRKY